MYGFLAAINGAFLAMNVVLYLFTAHPLHFGGAIFSGVITVLMLIQSVKD